MKTAEEILRQSFDKSTSLKAKNSIYDNSAVTIAIFNAMEEYSSEKDKEIERLKKEVQHLREFIDLANDIAEARESVKNSPKMTIEEMKRYLENL